MTVTSKQTRGWSARMIYSVCKTRVRVLEISPKVLNNDDEVRRLKKRIVHSMDKASVGGVLSTTPTYLCDDDVHS